MSSFGDCAAFSDKVDVSVANFLKKEVSDIIVAPGYDDEALTQLKKKKNGTYLILEVDPDYIDRAAQSGVRYLVQAGNSLRDDQVIEAANEYGIVMAYAGIRLFIINSCSTTS
ncbi:AICAR transformylase/IMP cyclohydrolase PurH [Paenibacillus eucommiae]|uniref:AICAR transformylase/IMP cyclohydrolase PurH n=2 Tax=Paenibacillus eucommiae TaxID=1355755 RepID=A0ABS4J559_9BACL|nr:AICAR transformylase/IMP cyclohydrolase PurH [Paenibacillus eucommiae]